MIDAPVWLSLRYSCGHTSPGKSTSPLEAFIAIHAGMTHVCERCGEEVLIVRSTMEVVTEPTRWVEFAKLKVGMKVWDWRQRRWVPIRRVDRKGEGANLDEGALLVEGRRRRIGPFAKDEKVAVLVTPEEMTPEARELFEKIGA